MNHITPLSSSLVDDSTCYVIAEAGLNHNGSMEMAKSLIDLAAIAGADAVKFQKRTISTLAVGETLDASDDRFPEFGSTYREIREHLEFDLDQYKDLKAYASSQGLDFIVTSFDRDATDFLNELDISVFKLASHSATNIDLLEYISSVGKPVIMSTGMAELDEVDTAVSIFQKNNCPLVLLHCVSAYPTPLGECNLSMIDVLKKRYGLPVGYSGHELGFLPTLSAVSMGACAIERHYTLDKSLPGFDHKMSLDPAEFCSMVSNIRDVENIKGNGVKHVSETEWITRKKYHVSVASSVHIQKGAQLTEEMITYRNPGTGIPAKDLNKIIGKRAIEDIKADRLLSFDMFE